jgi:UPF0176 protein
MSLGLLLVALAACGTSTETPSDQQQTKPTATEAPALPPAPQPAIEGPCPYLNKGFVEETNGQHVSKVMTSSDAPHPACFFYRPDGEVQLLVRIFVGEDAVAKGLVDQAAPVATSNPAELDGGWAGGYQKVEGGAVFAVAKGNTAVIVTTNQEQTIKARRTVEQAISTLGL